MALLLALAVTAEALAPDGSIAQPTAGTQFFSNATIGCGGNCTPFNAGVMVYVRSGGVDGPVMNSAQGNAVMGSWMLSIQPPQGGWTVGAATLELIVVDQSVANVGKEIVGG